MTPSGTISCACSAADPCQTPSDRVALPLTAAASGTVQSTRIWPGSSAPRRLLSVSDWARNGTVRKTIGPRRAAALVVEPLDRRLRDGGADPLGRLLGPRRLARADHDVEAGVRPANREPVAERAGAAEDRDRRRRRLAGAAVRVGRLIGRESMLPSDERIGRRSRPAGAAAGRAPRSAPLEAGAERTDEFEVAGPLLTDVGGTIGAAVLSTPGMIAMMERTAAVLAYEALPEGSATVGFEVCIKHVAAAAEGATCTARAKLTEVVDDRKLFFDVEVARGRADDRRRHPPAPGDRGAGRGPEVAGYPDSVRIREVGPRDGFQNEPEVIATADKVRLIEMLIAAGLKRIEVTSFVRADVIPQLADGAEVLAALERPDDVAFSVLIPNERGLENALAQPRPLRRDQRLPLRLGDPQPQEREPLDRGVARPASSASSPPRGGRGLRCEGVIATSFGCPYEGEVPPERVFAIAERLVAAGCEEIGFGDTTGMANPLPGRRVLRRDELAAPLGGEGPELTAHFHNTRGQGLANALAALGAGDRLVRVELRRARRLPGAARVDRQRRHRGPRLDAARDGDRDRGRPRGAARRLARGPGGARPPARRPPADRRPGRLGRRVRGLIVAAFLRGMNLGNRRITNADLRAQFEALGFASVATFQAAGNVIFEAGEASESELVATIERGLEEGLGYAVPTLLRSEEELRAIAAAEPFPAADLAAAGKLQVLLLAEAPKSAARDAVLAHASDEDRLAFGSRELFWLPSGRTTDSDLDLRAIEKQLPPGTMRTHGTIERLAAKHLGQRLGCVRALRRFVDAVHAPRRRSSRRRSIPTSGSSARYVPLLRGPRPRRHDPHRGADEALRGLRVRPPIEDPDEPVATLIFRARVGDRWLDGLDLLSFDDEGLIDRAEGDAAADERRRRHGRGDGPALRGARPDPPQPSA